MMIPEPGEIVYRWNDGITWSAPARNGTLQNWHFPDLDLFALRLQCINALRAAEAELIKRELLLETTLKTPSTS